MNPQSLKQLGRYQIEGSLGSGAYADVYKALDTTLERVVALKVLKPALVEDEDTFSRFLQEAKVLSNLNHPRIAWAWDSGESDGSYYLAMRYIDGPSLDKVLAERGALPWDEALQITSQVAEALEFAHNKGLIHRDVKPQNILISLDEGAVLTDFGLARAMQASGMSTRSGAIIGTPQYIAPEIWKGKSATAATDQYALACVMTEMLIGEALFNAPNPPAVMHKHFQRPDLPEQWAMGAPDTLPETLQKAISQEPTQRFESLNVFLLALQPSHTPTQQPQAATPPDWAKQAEEHHKRGLKLYNAGEYAQAIEAFTEAIQLEPDTAWYYYQRGLSYQCKGDYAHAIADCNKALSLDPDKADYYWQRGVSYHNKGDYDRAIDNFTKASSLDPDKADYYWQRGVSYHRKGNHDRAIADKTRAISLDPNKSDYYYSRGASYHEKGDYERTIADKTRAISLDPNKPDYYYSRGVSYAMKKNHDRAIADYTKAISLDPNNAQYYYSRGASYHEKNDYDRAIADKTKAIKLDPNNAQYYYSRGASYHEKSDYDRAIVDKTKAIKLDPNNARYYYSRGASYHEKSDYGRAIADFAKAILLDLVPVPRRQQGA